MDALAEFDFIPLPEQSRTGVLETNFDNLLTNSLKIAEDGGAKGCGGKLWPAGDLLSRYLIRTKPQCTKVIELGSGTGLSGLAFALAKNTSNPEIFITDQQPMVPLMQQNIELNSLQSTVKAAELNWGEPLPAFCKDTDLILAADCVYLEAAFPLLENTLLQLTEGNQVPIIMAYKKRRKADRLFFKRVKKNFEVIEITDFPEYEQFHRDSVFLFQMNRKR